MIELFEPFISSTAESLTNLVFDIAKNGGSKLLQSYGDKRKIATASKEYARKYTERHGTLRVLGMRQSVLLDSVYTGVQFLSDWENQRFASIQVLEETFRRNSKRGFLRIDSHKQDGLSIARNKQYLMVLGEPGSGKSTFLRKMGLEALEGLRNNQRGFKRKCIPVLIELKNFNSDKLNIKKLIGEEFLICGFPSHSEFVETAINQGKLLILLDGLDEVVSTQLNEVITQIQNFVDQYDTNHFIASCRTAAYRSNFHRFTDVVMADFDDYQIEQFIHNWFQSELDKKLGTARRCWELLQKQEHAAAKELAQRPLLLTLICLVYDRSQNFPDKRSILYRKALDILLEEWAAEKRILQDEIYQGLNIELEKLLLSEIAYQGLEADKLFFTEEEIIAQIKKFLLDTLNAPKHLNGKKVLDAIVVQQGILVERAEYVYSFSHLTLQEYLTAKYIVEDYRQINNVVNLYLIEKRWNEVFLLVAGLMHNSDDLLLLIHKQAQNYINTPKIKALMSWVDQVTTDLEKNIKPTARRLTAIYIAIEVFNGLNSSLTVEFPFLNFLNELNPNLAKQIRNTITQNVYNDVDIAYKLAIYFQEKNIFDNINLNSFLKSLENIKLKQLNNNQQNHTRQRLFSILVCQIFVEKFKLNYDILTFSVEEVKSLEHYLYINYLLLKCKQESLRLSPKIW